MADAFIGKFEVESKENFEGFMKNLGIPDDFIKSASDIKLVTNIWKEDDSYYISRIRPQSTVTNKIVIGTLCELDTVNGDKIKVIPVLEGNKILAQGEGGDYSLLMEMTEDGKLKETIKLGGFCMSRISKTI